MHTHRSRLRVPAILGIGLFLSAGSIDALGWAACVHHGTAHAHGDHGFVSGEGPSFTLAEDSHQGHADHATHGFSFSASDEQAPADHGDDSCRLLCVGAVASAAALSVWITAPSFTVGFTSTSTPSASGFEVRRPTQRAHFLPISHAPPAVA